MRSQYYYACLYPPRSTQLGKSGAKTSKTMITMYLIKFFIRDIIPNMIAKTNIKQKYAKYGNKVVKNLYITLKEGISLSMGDTIVLSPTDMSVIKIEKGREVRPIFPYNNA